MKALGDGDRGTVLRLLLILLLDLEIVSFDSARWNVEGCVFDELFSQIVGVEDKICSRSQIPAVRPLTKLTEVNFIGHSAHYENSDIPYDCTQVGALGAFANIPSLRSINTAHLTLRLVESRLTDSIPIHSSNLESIRLMANRYAARETVRILSGCRALKYFIYDRGFPSNNDQVDLLIESLLENAKLSLESHLFTGFDISDAYQMNYSVLDDLSLRGFESLKQLILPRALLLEDMLEGPLREGWVECKSYRVHRLAHVLPASLQRLEIEGFTDIDTVASLLGSLVQYKTYRHLQLQNITFHDTDARASNQERMVAMRLRKACDDVGTLLDLR